MPTSRTVDQIKTNLLRPALTSHFEVEIPLPGANTQGKPEEFGKYLNNNGINLNQEKLRLLCSEAVLPGSSLATLELTNDFHGVTERHVHRRVYDDRIDLTFYVNVEDYLPIRFFETWIKWIVDESITGQDARGTGSESINYFYRMRYRDDYIAPKGLKVIKFERDYRSYLEYEFIGSFPISVTSMPVSYESSSLLKCTVSMTYIRYVLKPGGSVSETLTGSSSTFGNPDQQSLFNNVPDYFLNPQFGSQQTSPGPNDFLNIGNPALDQFGVRDQLGRGAEGTFGANILA